MQRLRPCARHPLHGLRRPSDELKGRLDTLLKEHRGTSLSVTRIARIYDGQAIFLLKPARLRYWLPSTALRDSDDTLADLRSQGF